jgi:1-aminocyclopropane-1-carboxylate deaminase
VADVRARLPSPLDELTDDRLARAGIRLYLKRDDLISPVFPGNKWRKLSLNLDAARRAGHSALLTFGGAYSNHIRATAAAGQAFGLATIGVIRGEEHRPLNPSLREAAAAGMRLAYLDRATYRRKTDPDVIAALQDRFGRFYLLPEGGSNGLAARGCARIPAEIGVPFDVICCPCGTGGTLAGIAAGLRDGQQAIGFSALRGGGRFLPAAVEALQREALSDPAAPAAPPAPAPPASAALALPVPAPPATLSTAATQAPGVNWEIDDRFHFGGFARRTAELDRFIAEFAAGHGLTLEWVYVAKMMYGIYARAGDGSFAAGTTVVAVITG